MDSTTRNSSFVKEPCRQAIRQGSGIAAYALRVPLILLLATSTSSMTHWPASSKMQLCTQYSSSIASRSYSHTVLSPCGIAASQSCSLTVLQSLSRRVLQSRPSKRQTLWYSHGNAKVANWFLCSRCMRQHMKALHSCLSTSQLLVLRQQ